MLVAVGGLIYLHSGAFRETVEARAAALLSAATGREATLQVVRLRPLRLAAEVADVRIAGRTADRPLLRLEAGSANLRLWPLLSNVLAVQDLELQGLEVDLAELPEPRPDPEPRPAPSLGELLGRVSVERASLKDSRLRAGAEQWPVELDLRDLDWTLTGTPGAPYRMDLAVRDGRARLADQDWFAVDATAQAELDAEGLRVEALRLAVPGVELTGTASLDDLPELTGAAEGDAAIALGKLPWPAAVDPGARPAGEVSAEFETRFSGHRLVLDARLQSGRLTLRGVETGAAEARVRVAEGRWSTTVGLSAVGARVDGTFAGPMAAEPYPIEGEAVWSATDLAALGALTGQAASLPVEGRAEGTLSFVAAGPAVEAVTGEFVVEARGLRPSGATGWSARARAAGRIADGIVELASLRAEGAGLTATGSGSAGLDEPLRLELAVTSEGAAGETLQGALAVLDSMGVRREMPAAASGLRGRLDLEARLRGPGLRRFETDALAGEMKLVARDLTAAGESGLPLDADVALTLDGRSVVLRTAELKADGFRLLLSGTADPSRIDAEIALHAAAGTAPALFAEWTGLGFEANVPAEWLTRVGDLQLDGRLSGAWSALDGGAQLAARIDGGAEGIPARDVTVDATLRAGVLAAELRMAGGDAFLEAAIETTLGAGTAERGRLRFDVVETAPRFWLPPSLADVSLEGRFAAQGELDLTSLRTTAALDVTGGAWNGRGFDLSETRLTVGRDRIEIAGARLALPGGALQIDGALGGGGDAALRLTAKSLDLDTLARALGSDVNLGGTVDLEAALDGSLATPRLVAQVETRGLAVEGQPLTDLTGPVSYANGVFELELVEIDAAAHVVGRLELASQDWTAEFDYPVRLDLAAWTPAVDDGPLVYEGRVTGALAGRGAEPTALAGRVAFPGARVGTSGETLAARGTPEVALREGRATLTPTTIETRGASLVVGGELGLEDRALSLTAKGDLPLRPLSSQLPGSRLDGMAALDLRLGGTLGQPVWQGTLRVYRGRFDLPELPAPMERVAGTVTLGPDAWAIDRLEFLMGGGAVQASGDYRPATTERRGNLQLRFEGTDVRFPSLEGLRAQVDVDLRVAGDPANHLTVSGNVTFDRAVYATDIDLQRELLGKARLVDSVEEIGGVLDRIRLDIQADAPGTLFVRNNLASIQTSANLRIGGTAADPLVTGRAELQEGGKVVFRNVTYNVVRGTLDYTADRPDNPRVDIEGQTSVGTYDVTLLISGKLEDPRIDLTSSPPLSQADIVSLLVTGRTRDALASSGAGISEAQAALYLGSGITREVERTLARSLGLDQVTLDPGLVAAEDDPEARLTVGKALTGRLFASYSREFGETQGDIYQLRFTPAERLTLVGQHDDEGEFLADAVYERRFYQGPPRAGPPEAQTGDGRIGGVAVTGNAAVETKRLLKALGLRERDRFRRTVLLDGLEAIRELYLERGFPEAEAEAQVEHEGGDVTVNVQVREGRRVELRVNGPYDDDLKRELLSLWQQSVFRDDIAEDARRRAVEIVASHGYVHATVETRLESAGNDTVRLHVDVTPGPRVRIAEVAIEGNAAIDAETIRQQMLSLGDSLLKKDWLRPQLLAEDHDAIRSLYLGRGYLDARIEPPRVSYPENDKQARVEIVIEEGRAYAIGEIVFTGNDSYDEARLREIAGLKPGQAYSDPDLRAARGRLRTFYDEQGHAGSRIDIQRTADAETSSARVTFAIEETPPEHVESIRINNPGLTRTKLIVDQLKFEAGDPLSEDDLARSRQALYRTGLFRSVTLEELPGEAPGGRIIELSVDERANIRTQLGIGYGTDQGIRGSASVSHSNLFGERLHGSTGFRASESDWRVYGLLREPKLWDTGLQGLASASVEQEEQDAFDVRRKSVAVQIEPEATERQSRWFAGYRLQEADVFRDGVEIDPDSIPDLGELIDLRSDAAVLLADVNVGVNLGRRDDFAWPTRGNVLHASLSAFDGFVGSEADFLRASAQWSVQRPLGSGRIWSMGLRLGMAEPHGGQDAIPLSERFFVGGDNTVRGFARDAIFPVGFPFQEFQDAGADVSSSLGGEALIVVNQELIVPVFDPVAVVGFYDAGNIYWERGDWDPTDLRHAAGLGFRIRTPVGPVRLEYGWKLDREPDEDGGRLHFSIGVPF